MLEYLSQARSTRKQGGFILYERSDAHRCFAIYFFNPCLRVLLAWDKYLAPRDPQPHFPLRSTTGSDIVSAGSSNPAAKLHHGPRGLTTHHILDPNQRGKTPYIQFRVFRVEKQIVPW